MKQIKLPRYVSAFRDTRGTLRYRFRCQKKGIDTYMKERPFSPAWEQEYRHLLDGVTASVQVGAGRYAKGTIGDLIQGYRQSVAWTDKKASTRRNWEGSLGKLAAALASHRVNDLKSADAQMIIDAMSTRPSAADNFRKRMSALWRWGIRKGLARENPWTAVDTTHRKTPGFKAWSEDDVAKFSTRFPPGTLEYLAMILMLNTFARRSDAVRLGPNNIVQGRLRFIAKKNEMEVNIPILPDLAEALANHAFPGSHFLMTQLGYPFSEAGFGQWFAEKCQAAGVSARAHGLRKLAAIRMAYAGATVPELMAWGGWRSDREPLRYIQQAQRSRLADSAAQKLSSAGEFARQFSN